MKLIEGFFHTKTQRMFKLLTYVCSLVLLVNYLAYSQETTSKYKYIKHIFFIISSSFSYLLIYFSSNFSFFPLLLFHLLFHQYYSSWFLSLPFSLAFSAITVSNSYKVIQLSSPTHWILSSLGKYPCLFHKSIWNEAKGPC